MVSHGKPVWIDFGMIGRITQSDIKVIQQLVLAGVGDLWRGIADPVRAFAGAPAGPTRLLLSHNPVNHLQKRLLGLRRNCSPCCDVVPASDASDSASR